ncbi:MAG: PAS domain-containing protein [Opitutaceae bacterium]|jgi:PAS domain S-box-containing protein
MQFFPLAFVFVLAALVAGAASLIVRQRRHALQLERKEAEAQQRISRLAAELSERGLSQADAERELAAARAYHRYLALAADLGESGACFCDHDGLIVWVNKSWENSMGYSLAEVAGKKPSQILQGPNSDPAAIDRVRQAIRKRCPVTEEMRNTRKDGAVIWVRLTITPVFAADGQLEGFFGSTTDISEEKIVRDRLIHSNEKSELALAAGSFGVWEWLPLANTCAWDERSRQLFGIDTPVTNFERWMACVHRGDVNALETRLRNALLGNTPLDAIFRVSPSDGATRYISIRGLIVRDDQKQPQRVIGIARDISDDVALREQLQLAGNRLHLSLMGANDGVWEWQVEEDRLLMDEHWTTLTGISAARASMTRQAFERQLHPEDVPLLRGALNALRIDSHSRLDVECRIMDGAGRWIWIRWRGNVVSVDLLGEPMRVCGTYSDVTLRRQNEESLRRSALLLRQMCQQMGIAAWELDVSSFSFTWTEELDLLHAAHPDFEPSLEHMLALYPKDARRELSRALEAAIEKRETFDIEVRWRSPGSDHNRWYRWTGGPMMEGEQVQAVCGLIQDVTATRETAAQRRELDSRLAELHQYEALSAIYGRSGL